MALLYGGPDPVFAVRTRSLRPASAMLNSNDLRPTARVRRAANRCLMVLQREYNPMGVAS
jgi:hypothetical protein